jgi:sucrose-6-phosphate hydrolase SacC (GH32 family)
MPAVTGAFPYNVDNLLGGAVRILYAPVSVAIPASIADVIDTVAPYAPKTGWIDFGATKEAFSYSRAFDVSGYEIQQVPGAVLEDITDLTRTVTLSVAELTDKTLQILEEGTIATDVATGTGLGAQDVVKFGSFLSVTQYRVAFISRRHKGSGTVNEGSGVLRGRFFMGAGYRCQMTADEVSLEGTKGELAAASLTFKFFPESGETSGQEYGAWFMEQSKA